MKLICKFYFQADAGMAAKECAQRGHELLSITGRKENDLVKQYLNDYGKNVFTKLNETFLYIYFFI